MGNKRLPKNTAPPSPDPPSYCGSAVSHPGMSPLEALPPGAPAPPPPPYHEVAPFAPAPAAPVTVVTQLIITQALRDRPGQAMCPRCQQLVLTTTHHFSGRMTWAICAALFCFGFYLCCCIPFCDRSCKDVEHRCPACQTVIYTHRRW